jgi:Ni,Fe-hydrogenase III large subunit
MRLHLALSPARSSSPRGWTVQINEAQLELGYNHVGLEERAYEGMEWGQALRLVESLCGCCSQANTLAFVQAVEAMGNVIVPIRATYLRLALIEAERIISHLLNGAETLDALGLGEMAAPLRDLRERAIHTWSEWTEARAQPGLITYGGLSRNIDEATARSLILSARSIERALRARVTAVINSKEVSGRLVGLGVVKAHEASLVGLRGPNVRGSGIAKDIRATFPTGAYHDEGVTIVSQRGGDAFARLVVRLLECLESLRIIEQALNDLPGGVVRGRGNVELRPGSGIGRIEGPRGEVFCWARGDQESQERLNGLHLSGGSSPALSIVPGLLKGHRLEDLRLILLSLDICLASAER